MPDIFDLFKENEEKLHERPAEKVWQKLEKKLDKTRRPRRRGIRFLQPVTVVLILFLLLLAILMAEQWLAVRLSYHAVAAEQAAVAPSAVNRTRPSEAPAVAA